MVIMTESNVTIKKGTVKRAMKAQGRVSNDAVDAMHAFLNEFFLATIKEAQEAQNHAGRKTIKAEDIVFVTKKYLSQ